MTLLDDAYLAMTAAPHDDTVRLRFYERIADGELFLLLDGAPERDTVIPRIFELEDGPVVLAFDREDRLSDFTGEPSPYAVMPGRTIAIELAGQGIGFGLNLGVAPSSFLIPASAVDWLAATLGNDPAEVEAKPAEFHAPSGLPEVLVTALDTKLARAEGLAIAAMLAGVTYDDGRQGHMLAFIAALPGAETALARAAAEALTFCGIEAGEMDVAFLSADDPSLCALARVALRFDLPSPMMPTQAKIGAPGSDPERPPILR